MSDNGEGVPTEVSNAVKSEDMSSPDAKIIADNVSDQPTGDTTENESNIEFHSHDIKSNRDRSDFFVNIEGADRIAREKELAAKRESAEQAKRARDAEREEKRQQKQAADDEKNAKRLAASDARMEKIDKIKDFVALHRRLVTAVVIIVVLIILSFTVIIPLVKAGLGAIKKAEDEKIIEENRTEMIKAFGQLIGKKMTIKEVRETISGYGDEMNVTLNGVEGTITRKGSYMEFIRFELFKEDKEQKVRNFKYYNTVGGKSVSIEGGENRYYYFNGDELEESSTPEELVDKCILFMVEHGL